MADEKQYDVSLPPISIDAVCSALSEVVDWGPRMLGVPEWWKETKSEGINICIVDTGCDLKHPDLEINIKDAVDMTNSAVGPQDVCSHGSHVSGICCGCDNGVGIIGCASRASLYVAKCLGDNGNGDYNWIAEGIEWAANHKDHIDIISLSLGGPIASQRMDEAIAYAVSKGIIVIAAAGNSSIGDGETISWPAKNPLVISVGSINQNMQRSSFSSVGNHLDVMAPGERVYSCIPKSQYGIMNGTSQATPFISGIAALILAKHRKNPNSATPIRNNEDMRQHLIKTASNFDPSKKNLMGYGIVNPEGLLKET